MARDPEIQEILLRVDLVELIGAYLKLSRAGRSFKGLCPFHAEKTPSFHVYPADGIKAGFFHCFGCKKGGDALTFLIDRDGLSFQEALEQLARRVGVELPQKSQQTYQKRQNRFDILNQCQSHFRGNLKHPSKGQAARSYLEGRGFPAELWDRFGLGYALDAWDGLSLALGSSKESLQMAADQGVIRRRDTGSGYFDFFRNRLMFPIHNPAGQIVAFAGRDLAGGSGAKYMNTPETDLFKKGRLLYGLHQARGKIKETGQAIVVEGYFDVIRMHASGFEGAVAPMGTALTRDHLETLDRISEEIILLFDGDAAGHAAALRSLEAAWDLKSTVRVAHLPGGVDPDDFLKDHQPADMVALIEEAASSFQYLVESAVSVHGLGTPEKIQSVVDQVFDSMLGMQSRTALEMRLKELADRVGVSLESLRHDWDRLNRQQRQKKGPDRERKPEQGPGAKPGSSPFPSREWEARKGIQVLLLQDDGKLEEKLGQPFSRIPEARNSLQGTLEILRDPVEQDRLAPLIQAYLEHGPDSARQMWAAQEDDPMLWEIEAVLREYKLPEDPVKTLEDYTDTLVEIHILKQLGVYRQALRVAGMAQDSDKESRIALHVDQLAKRRDQILSKKQRG
jgi:DNA primase